MITEYVVGFLHDDYNVVLIEKNRPVWQAGFFNGVGGHIEEYDKLPHNAMVREFEEETGVLVPKWDHFLTLEGTRARVYCFAANDNGGFIDRVETKTDEKVVVLPMRYLPGYATVPNLKWIIPLMRQRDKYEPVSVHFYGDS